MSVASVWLSVNWYHMVEGFHTVPGWDGCLLRGVAVYVASGRTGVVWPLTNQ